MLRVALAAIAGGVILRLWALVSAAVLPWPSQFISSRQLPAPPPDVSAGEPSVRPTPDAIITERVEATPLSAGPISAADDAPAIPFRGYYRPLYQHAGPRDLWQQLGIDLSIGLAAALAAIALPLTAPWWRQAAFASLGVLCAVLVCDLSQAQRLDWEAPYVTVLCIDHGVAVTLVAAVALLVIHTPLPNFRGNGRQPITP